MFHARSENGNYEEGGRPHLGEGLTKNRLDSFVRHNSTELQARTSLAPQAPGTFVAVIFVALGIRHGVLVVVIFVAGHGTYDKITS